MSAHPANGDARRRLLDAQRAESRALRAVITVERRKDAQQERLDAIDEELVEAQLLLVSISGLSRAAQLLDSDERELRQRVKRAEQTTSSPGTPADQ
jgi:hypothetical protein